MTSSRKLTPGDKLPDAAHVLRYIRKRFVDLEDQIAGDAFLSRPPEKDDGQENAMLAIDCIYDPLPAIEGDAKACKPPDPSHAYMKGVPFVDTPEGEAVRDLLVHCVVESFPVDPD